MLKHYVVFYYPGTFFPESESKVIKKRDPKLIKRPEDKPYAFQFFSRLESKVGGEVLRGDAKNYSGMYYFAGEVYTVAELKVALPNERILIGNIENNGYKSAILTDRGNWQPIDKDTTVLKKLKHGSLKEIWARFTERTEK